MLSIGEFSRVTQLSIKALRHYGPYEELGRSYQKLYETCQEKNLEIILPVREQYLKGPGMIFRGNPKKYVTKLMVPVKG